MPTLGVNIDHIATLRQARRTVEPEPVLAAGIAELAGADGITVHLREDRRHIQDRDVQILRQTVRTHLNLEMGATLAMVEIALKIRPDYVTLVPERREEVTTEGGLDVIRGGASLHSIVRELQDTGIPVSLFVDSDPEQIKASQQTGAKWVELHTGKYANALQEAELRSELLNLQTGAELAFELGLRVNAGHGLTYQNVRAIALIPHMEELNIGHSIISRAVLVGLDRAVREMKALISIP
jgi:pyridoxine 5-phosphate synthase